MASKTTGKRQAQAAFRRKLLLEAAFRLFSERGYRGTSVRDITRAADVTEAVLYHYFANKADLLSAVLATYAPLAGYRQIIEDAGETPVDEMLRRLGREFLRLVRERRAFVITLLSEAPSEPELALALTGLLQGVASDVGQFLAGRQAQGEIDPRADVVATAGALQGGLLIRFLTTAFIQESEDGGRGDEEAVDGLVTVILSGLNPRGNDNR